MAPSLKGIANMHCITRLGVFDVPRACRMLKSNNNFYWHTTWKFYSPMAGVIPETVNILVSVERRFHSLNTTWLPRYN